METCRDFRLKDRALQVYPFESNSNDFLLLRLYVFFELFFTLWVHDAIGRWRSTPRVLVVTNGPGLSFT
jgi:hypothetical protein